MRPLVPLALGTQCVLSSSLEPRWTSVPTDCRFAPQFTLDDVLSDPDTFRKAYIQRESKFHTSPDVAWNPDTGMAYDTREISVTTGLLNSTSLHHNGASSKEAQQFSMYALAMSGNEDAMTWVYADEPSAAPDVIMDVLELKLETYATFNETYPGFGGLFPWYGNYAPLRPDVNWTDQIPALDNGEMIWGVYALVNVLETSNNTEWQSMGQKWQDWLDYWAMTAAKVFYFGDGNVCTVTDLNQNISVWDPQQNYTCPPGTMLIDDPYEGELFTWWLYLYSPDLNDTDRELLWETKREKLVALNYTGSVVDPVATESAISVNYTDAPVIHPFTPITVQQGFWFSAHEQWKILEMPYLDVDIVRRVFHNCERARTCDASKVLNVPGMFASTDNLTDLTSPDHVFSGYVSACGIPSLATQTYQELDLITPYSVMGTMMFNTTVGLAWLHNMLLGDGMQGPYGNTEAIKRDGSAIANYVGWDSKVTHTIAMLGGIGPIVREKLKREGKYDGFIQRLDHEYSLKFGDWNMVGEDVDLCLPRSQIPNGAAQNFATCTM